MIEKIGGSDSINLRVPLSAKPGFLIIELRSLMKQLCAKTDRIGFFYAYRAPGNFESISEYFLLDISSGQLQLHRHLGSDLKKLAQTINIVQLDSNINTRLNIVKQVYLEISISDQFDAAFNLPTRIDSALKLELPDQIESSNRLIDLTIPMYKQTANKILKVFPLATSNSSHIYYEFKTASSRLFYHGVDEANLNWIYMDTQFYRKSLSNHRLSVVMHDELNHLTKQQKIEFNFNLIDLLDSQVQTFELEIDSKSLNSPIAVLDLKKHFPNSFKYLVLSGTSSNLIEYNKQTGLVIVKNNKLNHKTHVKILSAESDLTMAIIKFRVTNRSRTALKPTLNDIDLFISNRIEINSTIFNLNAYFGPNAKQLVDIDQEETFFGFDSSVNQIMIVKDLRQIKGVPRIQLKLFIQSNHNINDVVLLNINLLENLLATVEFSRLNYYFNMPSEHIGALGHIEMNKPKLIEQQLVHVEALSVAKVVCKNRDQHVTENMFYFRDWQLFFNATYKDSCDSYQILIQANLSNPSASGQHKTVTASVFLHNEERTLHQQRRMLLNQIDKVIEPVYSRQVHVTNPNKSVYSIDLFDLIKFKRTKLFNAKNVIFKATLLDHFNSHVVQNYQLNNLNGLLLITLNSMNINLNTKRFQFKIVVFNSDYLLLQQFVVNLFFLQEKFEQAYFVGEFVECESNKANSFFVFDLKTILFNPFNVKLFNMSLNSKLKGFRIDKHLNVHYEPNKLATGQLFNSTERLRVQMCNRFESCQEVLIFVKLSFLSDLNILSVQNVFLSTTVPTLLTSPIFSDNYYYSLNGYVFMCLISLICLTIVLSIFGIVYLKQGFLFCDKTEMQNNHLQPNKNANFDSSRVKLEISLNSDSARSPRVSTSSSSSSFCATRSLSGHTMLTNDFNSFQQRSRSILKNPLAGNRDSSGDELAKQQKLSVANLLAYQIQESYFQTENNSLFDSKDFDFVKLTLNWQPSFEQFKLVIKEFEQFPSTQSQNLVYHETDLNDEQTFV